RWCPPPVRTISSGLPPMWRPGSRGAEPRGVLSVFREARLPAPSPCATLRGFTRTLPREEGGRRPGHPLNTTPGRAHGGGAAHDGSDVDRLDLSPETRPEPLPARAAHRHPEG